ncbi:hypothetical protein COB21_00895 [Candidatus Aerophobetes bacterium]|uniref:Endonuclease n=1 Tax=Aerophobetes bacterium TaxID=2030807 RepID=A0A2A4X7Y2_UNCAE|nr:MAG: hypothetical protein COB21_00895 [Candidatus Aerophobetes bacterium]
MNIKKYFIILTTLCALGLAVFIDPSAIAWIFNKPSKISRQEYPHSHPILEKENFTLCYDGKNKVPLWTLEKLDGTEQNIHINRKSTRFNEDKQIYPFHRSSLEDYKHSGYDRGHLCPAKNHKQSFQEYSDTFLLSNICPMPPEFNQGIWKQLENYAYNLSKTNASVTLISGPLFIKKKHHITYAVIGENNVAVPTHFFKVIHIEDQKHKIRTEVFVIDVNKHPQSLFVDKNKQEIDPSLITTLAYLENVSGITFPRYYNE